MSFLQEINQEQKQVQLIEKIFSDSSMFSVKLSKIINI